jgi:hypothetical protein
MPTTHHEESRIGAGRHAKVAITDRVMLVITSIFEVMLGPKTTIRPHELGVFGSHSLISIVEVGTFDTVEDVGILGTHGSVVLVAESPDRCKISASRCGVRAALEIALTW